MRAFSDLVLSQASNLLEASKSLDYNGIVNHNPEDIAKLKAVLKALKIISSSAEPLENYALQQKNRKGSTAASRTASTTTRSATSNVTKSARSTDMRSIPGDDKEALARRSAISAQLATEGFDERLGKIYNSFSMNRSVPLSEAPHRKGLPPFDMVVAPDYSPCSGMHGIFINGSEVMSIILPSEAGSVAEWTVVKRKPFANTEEMVDAVTLLSAGFE